MLNFRIGGKPTLVTLLLAGSAAAMSPFSDWSKPRNLASIPGTGAGISTPAVDGCASLSPDGLSIAFTSNRTGNFDIYVASRASRSGAFGSPVRLPAPVSTNANDACPTIVQGNRLFFSSDRDDTAYDLYGARQIAGRWSVERLGPNINRSGWLDESAAFYEDDGHRVMLFSSRRPDGSDGEDLRERRWRPRPPGRGGTAQLGVGQSPEHQSRRQDDLLRFRPVRHARRSRPLLFDQVRYLGRVRAGGPSPGAELARL